MSNLTIRTAEDDQGNYDLVIPISPCNSEATLKDRVYASMNASTNGIVWDEHTVRVNINDGVDQINLHFECVYLAMSAADWDRVVNAVAEARAAAAKVTGDTLPAGIIAARAQRAAGINH